MRKGRDRQEKALKDIREGIREIQAGSGDSSEVALPEQINGYAVRPTSGGGSGLMILFLGGFATICIWGGNRSKIRGVEKEIRRAHVGVPGACG